MLWEEWNRWCCHSGSSSHISKIFIQQYSYVTYYMPCIQFAHWAPRLVIVHAL